MRSSCRQIAEGIEHADQARRLAELGCPMGQGFLFGAAVPIETALRAARHGRPARRRRGLPDASRRAYDVTMMSFCPALSAPQGIAFTSNCVSRRPPISTEQ